MSKSLSNKKTKRYADFVETENPQLSLFALLEDDRDDYSHTIELYDFLPKFVFGKPDDFGRNFVNIEANPYHVISWLNFYSTDKYNG